MATVRDLAHAWAAAADDEQWLATRRASLHCERGEGFDPDATEPRPCWKVITTVVEGRYGPEEETGPHGGDADEWCEPCRQRQAAHDALMVVRRRRAGLQSALRVAARREAGRDAPPRRKATLRNRWDDEDDECPF